MSLVNRGAVGFQLGVSRREVERLTQAGIIERPDADGFYNTEAPLLGALLAKSPAERRAAGVADNRGLEQGQQ